LKFCEVSIKYGGVVPGSPEEVVDIAIGVEDGYRKFQHDDG
jgi:hypothetical protein